jgi:hypothetical protein
MRGPSELQVATAFGAELDFLIAKYLPRDAVNPQTELLVLAVEHFVSMHRILGHALAKPGSGYRFDTGFTNRRYGHYSERFHDICFCENILSISTRPDDPPLYHLRETHGNVSGKKLQENLD